MASKGQKFRKYDKELIEEILCKHFDKHIDTTMLSKEYGIPKGTIKTWVLKTKRPDMFPNFGMKRGRPSDSKTDWKQRYEILKKYHAFLKAQRERK